MIIDLGIDDLNLLMPLGDKFYGASGLSGSFNPESFFRNWRAFLNAGAGKIFALVENDTVIGALGAVKYEDPSSGLLVSGELFWFINPEHRGGGLKLLKAYIEWAKAEGCKRITMAYMKNIMPEKLKTVYERFGFREVESAYAMEV